MDSIKNSDFLYKFANKNYYHEKDSCMDVRNVGGF